MRTIIAYQQFCHIHFYQKIAQKKVARVNAVSRDISFVSSLAEIVHQYLACVAVVYDLNWSIAISVSGAILFGEILFFFIDVKKRFS